MFLARLCLCVCVFEVMPLVGLLSSYTSTLYRFSPFLQRAFVFYIFNIPTHQIKRLGPNIYTECRQHIRIHITILPAYTQDVHRTPYEKKQQWTSNLLCVSNHLHVRCWWQRWRGCCWYRHRRRHQLCSVIAFVLLFVWFFFFSTCLFILSPFQKQIAILFTFCRAII